MAANNPPVVWNMRIDLPAQRKCIGGCKLTKDIMQFMPTRPQDLQAGTAVLRCADCRGKVVDATTRTISNKPLPAPAQPAPPPPPAQRTLAPAAPAASTSMPPPGRGPIAGPSTTTAGPSGTSYHPHASPATIDSTRREAKRRRTERYNKRAGIVDPSEMN
ncbi:unnamed protein product [Zymoseptoria tritici ST99CH_1E4]|uniref:Uncharacterized protein n=1 Tax=Zymoseptoria tritici ST99CH_1E4 TaxID=1276532 RepID=A0A2H1FYW9_ZYMTR|nr:unnamed protein product [Zymoseptoria tritici ST99CH_1E4]